jgi:hypothetical protein
MAQQSRPLDFQILSASPSFVFERRHFRVRTLGKKGG